MDLRLVVIALILGGVVAFTIILGTMAFLFIGYLDPNAPAIPDEAKDVVLALTGMMGGAMTFVFATVTAVIALWLTRMGGKGPEPPTEP